MITTAGILAAIAYTALWVMVGFGVAFVYFGRGQWRYFVNKVIPPQPLEYMETVLKELVEDKVFTAKQAGALTSRLWTDELKKQRVHEWQEAQESIRWGEEARKQQESIQQVRQDLNM